MVIVHCPFISLPSIYKPSFISIPFILHKIWPGQASIMKNKRLRGNNSINIQGRIMVHGFCPFPHFNANSNFKVIWRTRYQTDRRTKRRLSAPFGEHKNGIRFSPFAELVFSFLTYVLLPFLTNMTTSCKNQGVLFIQTIKRLTEKNIWLVTRRFLIWINEQSTG